MDIVCSLLHNICRGKLGNKFEVIVAVLIRGEEDGSIELETARTNRSGLVLGSIKLKSVVFGLLLDSKGT